MVLPEAYAVVREEPDHPVPAWVGGDFWSVTKSHDELSIVCAADRLPADVLMTASHDWRALRVADTLNLTLTGIMATIAQTLADADLSIFPLATYDTDYVLVQAEFLDAAIHALQRAGHEFIGR